MRLCAELSLCLLPASALARDLTIATWNLGWHIDKSTAATWIAKCNSLFEKDANTGVWSCLHHRIRYTGLAGELS